MELRIIICEMTQKDESCVFILRCRMQLFKGILKSINEQCVEGINVGGGTGVGGEREMIKGHLLSDNVIVKT